MQINYMPGNECLGAKSQGNMAKVNSCFPSEDKGFLQFWIGLQNMADEAGANSRGIQDHSDELPGQEDEAEKRACPVAFSFPFGIQALETGEKDFLHVLKTEGFPNCMQIGAEQEGKSRVSLPGMEAQGLTEMDTQKGWITESKNQVETLAESDIQKGSVIESKKLAETLVESKIQKGSVTESNIQRGILAESKIPMEAGSEIPVRMKIKPGNGMKKNTDNANPGTPVESETDLGAETRFDPGQTKEGERVIPWKGVKPGSDLGKGFSPGQEEENTGSTVGNVKTSFNRGEESAGFPGSRTQKGSGEAGEMFSPNEIAEENGPPLLENRGQGKTVTGMAQAEGISLISGSLQEPSQSVMPHGPQAASSGGVPIKGEDLMSQLVQKLEISRHLERSEMKVQLKPEHLGEVTIILVKERDILTARLVAENLLVKEALQAGLPQLRERLESQNVKVVEFHVEVDRQESSLNSEGGSQSGFQFTGETAQKGGRSEALKGRDESGEFARGQQGVSPSEYKARVDYLV